MLILNDLIKPYDAQRLEKSPDLTLRHEIAWQTLRDGKSYSCHEYSAA